jgi:hypothetical protein
MKKTNIVDSLDYRKDKLLNGSGEVELAIEGKFTNLRIWSTKHDNNIYMRLDRANQYSAPLSNDTINYLDKPHPAVNKLNELFGFNGATKDDIDTIIEITKKMVYRQCIVW